MRTRRWALAGLVVLALPGLIGLAAESGGTCPDVGFRVSGEIIGSPALSGGVSLDGALGFGEISIAAWGDAEVASSLSPAFGSELRWTKEWLSVALVADSLGPDSDWTVRAVAEPAAWLLRDGVPTLVGGASATASVPLRAGTLPGGLTVSPYLAGVVPIDTVTVTFSAGPDLTLDTTMGSPQILGSHLASTVDLGAVRIDNTVAFAGFYETFSFLSISVHVPDYGLAISGLLIPTGGGFVYRVRAEASWGAVSLLRKQLGEPGKICTGDVCF